MFKAVMSATSWTGGADTITATRPPLKSSAPKPEPIRAAVKSHMAEYAELAAAIGVKVPDLGIEAFKAFLEQNNITVFSLTEVIAHMDKRAAAESKEKSGWEWRPLREKDHREGVEFGARPKRGVDQWGQRNGEEITPGADYYRGPTKHSRHGQEQGGQVTTRHYVNPASATPYDRPIPLHALRKVALIEKGYAGDAAFFVSDYALAPQIEYPDPFLMVVVPNIDIKKGVGRFVIDFWDEPGFGLEQQLA